MNQSGFIWSVQLVPDRMLFVTRAAALQIIGTKESFSKQKGSTPTGLIWDTNLATISLFWDTNMVEVTSFENDP